MKRTLISLIHTNRYVISTFRCSTGCNKYLSNQTSPTVLNVSLSTGRTCFSSIFDLLTVITSVISFCLPLSSSTPASLLQSSQCCFNNHQASWEGPKCEPSPLSLAPLPDTPTAVPGQGRDSTQQLQPRQSSLTQTSWSCWDWLSAKEKEKCAGQMMQMKPVSRNTQRDETMLNQPDGRHAGSLQMGPQDVLVCWTGYRRLGFQAPRRQINPHEGGRQSFSRDPTGNNEWKEGSHLQNHNRADYLWWAERKHTQKRPSAVMLPPAVRSFSPFEIKLRFLILGPEQHAQHSDIRQQHDSGQLCHSLARVPLGT